MSKTLIEWGGQTLELHQSGALYWPAQKTLVLSDLHFEKGSNFLIRRLFLPPYDTAETLNRVETVMAHFKPERIILLGDVFHDAKAWQRMSSENKTWFEKLLGGPQVIWVEGNHDAGSTRDFVDSHTLEGLSFRHIATVSDFEISGHYHPAAAIRHKGTLVRAPCFVVNARQIIMPSFGAYTGGLDITEEAMAPFLKDDTRLFLLGQEKEYEAPIEKLDNDSLSFRTFR